MGGTPGGRIAALPETALVLILARCDPIDICALSLASSHWRSQVEELVPERLAEIRRFAAEMERFRKTYGCLPNHAARLLAFQSFNGASILPAGLTDGDQFQCHSGRNRLWLEWSPASAEAFAAAIATAGSVLYAYDRSELVLSMTTAAEEPEHDFTAEKCGDYGELIIQTWATTARPTISIGPYSFHNCQEVQDFVMDNDDTPWAGDYGNYYIEGAKTFEVDEDDARWTQWLLPLLWRDPSIIRRSDGPEALEIMFDDMEAGRARYMDLPRTEHGFSLYYMLEDLNARSVLTHWNRSLEGESSSEEEGVE